MPPPLIVLYSPSFGANRRKLEEHGIFNKTADYNRRLAALSQKAADGKAFVAGDISPTGLFLSPLGEASFEELVELVPEFLKACVAIFGGCCGTTAEHIAALSNALQNAETAASCTRARSPTPSSPRW
ncbi:MAG: homocysteine S-methyltransferase family protein [Firmicutes bacterium]|nr:homocysteine S-methyltransferase family protein [Bacillota bacterium]